MPQVAGCRWQMTGGRGQKAGGRPQAPRPGGDPTCRPSPFHMRRKFEQLKKRQGDENRFPTLRPVFRAAGGAVASAGQQVLGAEGQE